VRRCLSASCFEITAATRHSRARDKGPADSVNQLSTPSPNAWRSSRCRSRTNRAVSGRGLRRGVCEPVARARRPNSLPTPLPGAASGCNVKPNAQMAATEAAAGPRPIPLAGVLGSCWKAFFCRSQATSRIYDCSARCCREALSGPPSDRPIPAVTRGIASRRGMMVGIV